VWVGMRKVSVSGAGTWTQCRMQGRIDIDGQWRGVLCTSRRRGSDIDIGISQDGSKNVIWGWWYWWVSAEEEKKGNLLTGSRKSLLYDFP